jgi:hypothetical protein
MKEDLTVRDPPTSLPKSMFGLLRAVAKRNPENPVPIKVRSKIQIIL